MSKLTLSAEDIIKAVNQYYSDYEPSLYKKFDFKNLEPKNLGRVSYNITMEVEEL